MRILFLSQLLPWPLDAGPKIRAFYVLRHLVAAGHEVTLLCRARPDDRPEHVRTLERWCRSVVTVPIARSRWRDVRDGMRSAVSREPFLIRRDRSPAMARAVARLTHERTFDALHADQLWMAPAASNTTVGFTVLDQHNAVFKVPDRLAAHSRNPIVRGLLRAEARKLAGFERAVVDRFTRTVWVTREDRDAVCGPGAGADRHPLIPIAVDPSARPALRRPAPFRVTFLGGLHWPPNAEGLRWFVDRVWPRVAAAVPGAVLTVIGKGAPRWLRAATAPGRPRAATAPGRLSAATAPRIEVTGYVADPTRHLEETAACIVPLLSGAGMRVKILDAWSHAIPVVSTTLGAEGLAAEDGENLRLADDEVTFADRLIAVLRDRALADRIAAGGRATVEARYDWRRTYGAWDQVYR
ncbi:MAG: glycosyltransferase family 4 protein [Vicinamibacterales bacterium]